ncbi:MAG: hypothetical protein PHI34_10090 [Acidobacteriota bacterium]|nr:hypothetical protein [Acidobacteriota bacterium]
MNRRKAMEIIGQTAGGLFLAQFVTPACKQSTTSDENPNKTYTLKLYYERPTIYWSVFRSSMEAYLYTQGSSTLTAGGSMVYLDDYHFSLNLNSITPNSYCIDATDDARFNIYDGTEKVGDIFDIEVDGSGTKTRLNDIRAHTLTSNPLFSMFGKMACFELTSNGRIISDAQ